MFRTPTRIISTIKGLSDRRRLPRIDKIRLGIKKTAGGKEYPQELDYFRVPPAVAKVYGPTPKSLPILFPVDDPHVLFPQAYKWYGAASGLRCKGDGEIALRCWADVEPELQAKMGGTHGANDLIEIPCPCPRLDSKECSVKAHLLFMLPAFPGGVFQIDTGSAANIERINSKLDWIRGLFGFVNWIPLTLRREPVAMRYDGKQRTHFLLTIDYEGTQDNIRRIREERMRSAPPVVVLPVPSDEGPGINGDAGTSRTPPPPAIAPATSQTSQAQAVDEQAITTATGQTTAPDPPATAATIEARADAAPTIPPPAASAASSPPSNDKPARPSEPNPNAGATPPATPGNALTCACGATVTANVADYSRRYFQGIICINCQKKRFGKLSVGKKS